MYTEHKLVLVAGAFLSLFLPAYAYGQKGPKTQGKPASNVPMLDSLNVRIKKLEAKIKTQDEEIQDLDTYTNLLRDALAKDETTIQALVSKNQTTDQTIMTLASLLSDVRTSLDSSLSHFSYLCANVNSPESFTWILRSNECFVIVDRQYTNLAK